LSLAAALPPGAAPDEAKLDGLIEERRREAGLVGLAAAILVDGEVVWTKGYGLADREAATPFTPDTVMNVGSISKTVIGVAAMRAVEAGKLRLDDDVNAHLPFPLRNPRHPEIPITLRQIATHTSSLADRELVYESSYHQGGDSPVPLGDFLRDYFAPDGKLYSLDNFVAAKPGAFREYSNIGAGLAAWVIERAMGAPFAELTRREIFRPLGMASTGWFLSEIDRARHAKLYDASAAGRGAAVEIPLYGLATYPDGGLRTSVADLSRFFAMLLGGGELGGARILERASVEEMTRFHYAPANRPENVVLAEKNSGIFWSTKMDVTFVGHGGTDPGVQAEMLAEPSRRVAVILLTNTTAASGGSRSFYDIFRALVQRGREVASRVDAGKTGSAPAASGSSTPR
jgi:CubicO group peptidase (beta-lactamase class C family)